MDTLEKWHSAKQQIDELEDKIKKYKSDITKEMNSKNIDSIKHGPYTVTRRRIARNSLSKENVPKQIWEQYSVKCNYDSFYLKKS
jgi:hypothetical protein